MTDTPPTEEPTEDAPVPPAPEPAEDDAGPFRPNHDNVTEGDDEAEEAPPA